MAEKGHFSLDGVSGNLILNINVKPHSYFKRDEFDILTDAYISVSDAILGKEIEIETLNGPLWVKVDPGT